MPISPDQIHTRHRTVRGHLRWIVPLLLAPLLYVSVPLVMANLDYDQHIWHLLPGLLLFVLWGAGPIVCLILAIRGLYLVFRSWRNASGHFTAAELAAHQRKVLQREDERASANMPMLARQMRRELLEGQLPPAITLTDMRLHEGEQCYIISHGTYARFYGMDVTYSHPGAVAVGRPTFVAAAMIGNAIGRSRTRATAEAMARAQWRERQDLEYRLTSHRILCRTAARGWLSFWFGGVVALHPDLDANALVMEFEEGEPLFLQGTHLPLVSQIAVLAALGHDGMRAHPVLQRLDIAA